MASIAAHHAEWLSLLDVSGPFLSVRVLKEALPNGLDAHDPQLAAEMRAALEQWADPDGAGLGSADDVEVHLAFVRFVLHEVLGFDDDVLRWDAGATSRWTVEVPQVGMLTPDAVVLDGDDAALLVSVVGPGARVDEIVSEVGTLTSQERMVEHLKATGVRVGLVTDGERWSLVSVQEGESPGFATWWSSLWGEEKVTLQAFRTLLHQDRFVSMGADETIAGLLNRSSEDQREVTTKLGNQTLDAVEILIRTIDRIDQERGGTLLADVPVEDLYDAAVTVMMRLIFLFYAEENELLPVVEPLYNDRYAASTLRERLQAAADEYGEEVLETTHDGWPRLLATWRAVFGGVEHNDMVLAPYGGSLFDPDRYPLLEGRLPGTSWVSDRADPLPIDNRTVLHLLSALQTLDEGGQRRKLSFRALDVEQIGHVYEGMLDHTAARADGWVLGLSGVAAREPEIELDLIESLDEKALLSFLKEQTGRSPATLKKWVDDDEADKAVTKFGITWTATFADADLEAQARRFAKLIRPDSTGAPTVFQPGSVYVADSSHRGATGTHYTPRSLTEEIVKHTLDALVYVGPANGTPEDEWELRTPEEILDLKICDPACGSGAFLVQACRYLADVVVEANRTHQRRSDPITQDEIIDARRQVAERCLHGVDINPMACEMAKLSLWLITLAHDRPFTFLDHAIRNGDSLIGLTNLDQVSSLTFHPSDGSHLERRLATLLQESLIDRVRRGEEHIAVVMQGATATIDERKSKANRVRLATSEMELVAAVADRIVANQVVNIADKDGLERSTLQSGASLSAILHSTGDSEQLLEAFRFETSEMLTSVEFSAGALLHWPVAFPHIFGPRDQGFDAIIGNPPFLGGLRITEALGGRYNELLSAIFPPASQRVDLCAYFFRRATQLASSIGLLATNSIAEGTTRRGGLDRILSNGEWRITRAKPEFAWPGAAAVVSAAVWLFRGDYFGEVVLDAQPVTSIDSFLKEDNGLAPPVRIDPSPVPCSMGAHTWGQEFILDQETATTLIHDDERNGEVVRRCLGGGDINEGVNGVPHRWIVNFLEMTEAEARSYEAVWDILESSGLREARLEMDERKYRRIVHSWWKYFNPRQAFLRTLAELEPDHLVVRSSVSTFHVIDRVPADYTFLHTVVTWVPTRRDAFGVLQSGVHEWWARAYGSRLGSSLRYTVRDCFETFVFPADTAGVAELGDKLHRQRRTLAHELGVGIGHVHELLSDDRNEDDRLALLRSTVEELDLAVLDAYGWNDLRVRHGFQDTEWGRRFTIDAEGRREVLRRLLELNHQVAADRGEVDGGHPELSLDLERAE